MALQGARYRNEIFPNKIRGCKRRYNQADDPSGSLLPSKVPVTEQEMSSRLYGLSLDQIDISHFLLYPQARQEYSPPAYPLIVQSAAIIDTSTEHIEENSCEDTADEEGDTAETEGLLTQEKLRVAIDKTTEILPRDIIESIINSYPSSSCTAVALWRPIDRMLNLSQTTDVTETTETIQTEEASTDVIDRSTEYFDEVMDIDFVV